MRKGLNIDVSTIKVMTSLVACLSTGKGTWGPLMNIAGSPSWEHIFLIAPKFFAENFESQKQNMTVITIDENKETHELAEDIRSQLDGKLSGDVALNLGSGSGKEHMAVLSALLKLGCGIRIVTLDNAGNLKEL